MEGRAIARPNRAEGVERLPQFSLQWRAGQLPGQTRRRLVGGAQQRSVLQWRAGQLPGQTAQRREWWARRTRLQWRAGQLPGQTAEAKAWARMLGLGLQWRAGQLPGQTG